MTTNKATTNDVFARIGEEEERGRGLLPDEARKRKGDLDGDEKRGKRERKR